MAKPEWGQKRTCQSCAVRFYDMKKTPIVCPKCGAVNEAEPPARMRRGSSSVPRETAAERAAIAAATAAKAAKAAKAAEEPDEAEDAELDDEGKEDEELIEDASDLGEDEDDVAEVKEHIDDGGTTR